MTKTIDAALKLALEALEFNQARWQGKDAATTAIKQALEAPVQEPYCYVDPVHLAALNTDQSAEVVLHKNPSGYAARGLYTAPQQRPWVELTADEKGYCAAPTYLETVARVEAKLKAVNGFHSTEKNNG